MGLPRKGSCGVGNGAPPANGPQSHLDSHQAIYGPKSVSFRQLKQVAEPRLRTPPRPDAEECAKEGVQQLALKVEGMLTSHVDPSRSLHRSSRLGTGSLGTCFQSGVTGDFVQSCPFDGSLSASGGQSSWKTFPAEAESHKAPPAPPPHWSRTPQGSHQFVSVLSSLKGIYPEFQVIRGFSQKIPAGLLSYDQIYS